MRVVNRVLMLAVLAGVLMTTFGCNTVKGVGKDTQKAGKSIQKAADNND